MKNLLFALLLTLWSCAQHQEGWHNDPIPGADHAAVGPALIAVLGEQGFADVHQEPDGRIHGLEPDRTPADSLRPHRVRHVSAWIKPAPGGCVLSVQVLRFSARGGTPFVYTGPHDSPWHLDGRDEAAEAEIAAAVRARLAAPAVTDP